jgi:hypothetical protein
VENAVGVGAHGKDMHDAVLSLRKKIKAIARKENQKITMDTSVTRTMYREITGACAEGVKDFCERYGLENKRSIKVRDLLPLLKGEYGEESFLNSITAE